MDPDQIVTLLLGAGGAGAAGGLVNIIQSWRKGKLDKEGTLLSRLNEDNKTKDENIDNINKDLDLLRSQRNKAWDQAALYRRMLLSMPGIDEDKLEKLVDFND